MSLPTKSDSDSAGSRISADGDQTVPNQPVAPSLTKEHETRPEEEGLLSEIVQTAKEADEAAEKAVKEAISEAGLAQPEPEIPPEVSDAGVRTREEEANKVLAKGTTIQLPITQEEYQAGLHQKVVGAVVNRVVVGVSSLFALASWVGRIIKVAHKKALKVVFRGGT